MTALDRVAEWPVATVAAGWIDAHGRRSVIGSGSKPLPLASVTKPLFAYGLLVAVEEGTLGLDQPAGPPGSTIRHLMAHASGLGDDPETPISGLGRRRVYSNGGFEALGRELTSASGLEATLYFREAVVEPLGLAATVLDGSPAHGATSSVDDLLTLAAEWLNPTLVAPTTMVDARTAQFPDLRGVLPGYGLQDPNPWGLGFEIKGSKDPHWTGSGNSPATFGHFGRAGTFLWVDPSIGVACVALTDREFGPWAVQRWPELADAVVAEVTGKG